MVLAKIAGEGKTVKARPAKAASTKAAPRAKRLRGEATIKAPKKLATIDRKINGDKHTLKGWYKLTTKNGNPTLDSGDQIAVSLRGKELDEVYAIVAKAIGETQASLKARYAKLNPGMQRMNLGNRLRAGKKAD